MADLFRRKQINGALDDLPKESLGSLRPAGKSGTQFFANTDSPGFGQISGPVTSPGANKFFPPSGGKVSGEGLSNFMRG